MRNRKMTPTQEQYAALCRSEQIPLMMQAWWLEAVCPGQWDALLYEESGQIVAAFAYHLRKKWKLRFILQPRQTQYGGLWIKSLPTDTPEAARLAREKRIIYQFIDQLDAMRLHFLEVCLHYSYTNHLPFYWRGWKQDTRYTYIIPRIGNPEKCIARFSASKRRQIKKAEGHFTLDLSLSPDRFYTLHKTSLQESGHGPINYGYAFFLHLWKAATERKQGQIFALRDAEGNIHCAHFIVWDRNSAYDLIYFIQPRYAASGASTLIIAEILRQLQQKTRTFDFEGSMIESVENSYRQFGTLQKPYHHLTRAYNPLVAFLVHARKKRQNRPPKPGNTHM
ncbi:MAG: GNAT family N-acetyltransferase [Bacteroidaceae bacterium]|jgi:hypothetical protein